MILTGRSSMDRTLADTKLARKLRLQQPVKGSRARNPAVYDCEDGMCHCEHVQLRTGRMSGVLQRRHGNLLLALYAESEGLLVDACIASTDKTGTSVRGCRFESCRPERLEARSTRSRRPIGAVAAHTINIRQASLTSKQLKERSSINGEHGLNERYPRGRKAMDSRARDREGDKSRGGKPH